MFKLYMMFEPSSRVLLILMLTLFKFLSAEVTSTQSLPKLPPDEVNALTEIAKELGKQDWDSSQNPCKENSNWGEYVVCDCLDVVCHVVNIMVSGEDLAGVLPKSLAKLPFIKFIDLSYNNLNGTIPGEWASMQLEILFVAGNHLSGSIPKFLGNMTSLQYLMSLGNNMFSGNVPAELGKLVNLSDLLLSANYLTGELPVELSGLTNLIILRLGSNNFSAKIPDVGNWTKLKYLGLQASGLEGPIPSSVSLLRNLIELRITDVYGKVSQFPDLSYMTSMKKLMLRSCNISGTIPSYISQMSNLSHLDLSFNNLEGRIPEELKGLLNLRIM